MKKRRLTINPFSINVPIMDKPGSWLLPAKCLKKQLWKSDILLVKTNYLVPGSNIGRKWVNHHMKFEISKLTL